MEIRNVILYELSLSDKYVLELSKSIYAKTNQNIKQNVLNSNLKKLEKSKFIATYWQDSDIGGKRHYYKLTEKAKEFLSTLPPYDEYLNNIVSKDEQLESYTNDKNESDVVSDFNNEEKPKTFEDEDNNQLFDLTEDTPLSDKNTSLEDDLSLETDVENLKETVNNIDSGELDEKLTPNSFSNLTEIKIEKKEEKKAFIPFQEKKKSNNVYLANFPFLKDEYKKAQKKSAEEIINERYLKKQNKKPPLKSKYKYIDAVDFEKDPHTISYKERCKKGIFITLSTFAVGFILSVLYIYLIKGNVATTLIGLISAVSVLFYVFASILDNKNKFIILLENKKKLKLSSKIKQNLIISMIFIILFIVLSSVVGTSTGGSLLLLKNLLISSLFVVITSATNLIGYYLVYVKE